MKTFLVLCLLAVSVVAPAPVRAQSDPEAGYFESEGTCAYCDQSPFGWTFADDFGQWGYYVLQSGDGSPYVFGYIPQANIFDGRTQFYPYLQGQQQYHVDYGVEGFHTDVLLPQDDGQGGRLPDLSFQAYVYVPAAGISFARFMFKITNTGDEELATSIRLNGNPMFVGEQQGDLFNIVGTGDGDRRVEARDNWAVVDDEEGVGNPVAGIVWAAQGAEQQATIAQISGDAWGSSYLDLIYDDVVIAAGETKTIGLFLLKAETREQAMQDAEDLAAMRGAASDYLEVGDVEDTLVNFAAGDASGPRLRSNGPYVCDEGGSTRLGITVEDRDGEGRVDYSWDLDGNGVYGELANTPDPLIDCTNADGASSLSFGVRLVDDEGLSENRTVSVAVQNLPPIITSEPGTIAATEAEYTYPITVTDFPGDTFTYELEQAPEGMTVSEDGMLRWTPLANGIGPEVPVELVVRDDDGGEAEQNWVITMQGGPTVNTGGPYEVLEGDEIELQIVATDPESPDDPSGLTYAWDLDADGEYDDSSETHVTWSAAGIDGPSPGFGVSVRVSDGQYEVTANVPIEVRNAPPLIVSVPSATATVNREWTYTVQAVDPAADPYEVSVDEDEMPEGMVFDALTASFSWVPDEADLGLGDPPGEYCFTVTAEDDDRGRGRQEVCVTIGRNAAPPVPVLKYPDDAAVLHVSNPTIILENVVDPDGDPVQSFIDVDHSPCFCSEEYQGSGPVDQGELVTQFSIPRPFNVDEAAGGHTLFYVRRWTSDGLAESAKEITTYRYEPGAGGDGDADADADGDADAGPGDDDGGDGCG